MTDELKSVGKRLHEDIERRIKAVPVIGSGWRWYDFLYRPIRTILGWRFARFYPRWLRSYLNRSASWLLLFNMVERERASRPDDPLHNIIVPEGEKVELPVFWVVEYFSPSYAEVLHKRLGPKGILAKNSFGGDDVDIQVKQARQGGRVGGFSHLTTWLSVDNSGFDPRAIRASLPTEIQRVSLTMHPMGSGLTAFVAAFHLTQEASELLDRVLRQKHKARIAKRGGRRSVEMPYQVGAAAVQEERERIHRIGCEWLARQLPGVFAEESALRQPVLDLVVTRVFDPFLKREDRDRDAFNYRSALGFDLSGTTRVVAPDAPGVRLANYQTIHDGFTKGPTWALVAKYDGAFPDGHPFFNGERSVAGIANVLALQGPTVLSRLAISSVLQLNQRRGASTRDIAYRSHAGAPVRSAKKLKESVLRDSIDLVSVAKSIETFSNHRHLYEMNLPSFMYMKEKDEKIPEPSGESFWSTLAAEQKNQAQELVADDTEMVRLTGVVSSLSSSIEGIRAQRLSIVVAALSLIIAVLALMVSLNAPPTAVSDPGKSVGRMSHK